MAKPRISLLLALSPPLLAELTVRRLASCDLLVVVAAEGAAVPPGHYDVVVRNRALPPGVTGDLVVDLPTPVGATPLGTTPGDEVVELDRLEDLADLLAARWSLDA